MDHFSSKSSFGESVESTIESPPPLPPLKKTNSRKKNAINTLLNSPSTSPTYNENEIIEDTIRKKTDLEKWSEFF